MAWRNKTIYAQIVRKLIFHFAMLLCLLLNKMKAITSLLSYPNFSPIQMIILHSMISSILTENEPLRIVKQFVKNNFVYWLFPNTEAISTWYPRIPQKRTKPREVSVCLIDDSLSHHFDSHWMTRYKMEIE